MAHHILRVPKLRQTANGTSALYEVAKAMNDIGKRDKWDAGIVIHKELHRVDDHL